MIYKYTLLCYLDHGESLDYILHSPYSHLLHGSWEGEESHILCSANTFVHNRHYRQISFKAHDLYVWYFNGLNAIFIKVWVLA